MENQNFKYSAFISYKHLDKKEAAFIQRRLENYRLPTKLCKEYGLHNKLKKCFRDVDDLAGTVLKEAILEEMKQCKFMILVCSPNVNIDGEYINYEVEEFRKLRGDDYIIPVIIDGSPDDDDSKKRCFPTALTQNGVEHLGVSFAQDGKNKAILKIVATILGVSADAIIMREQRRKRQKQAVVAFTTACFMVLFYFIVDFYTPKTAYYIDYAVKDGVPVGIGELSRAQKEEKSSHFTIIEQNVFEGLNVLSSDKIYQVRQENSKGNLSLEYEEFFAEEKQAHAIFTYNSNGGYSIDYKATNGRPIVEYNFPDASRTVADLVQPGYESQLSMMSASTTTVFDFQAQEYNEFEDKSYITRHVYEYKNGYISKVLYMKDNHNTPARDIDGVYGLEYIRNDVGQITQTFFLDANYERMTMKNGLYSKRYTYNNNYQLVKAENLNEKNEAIYIGDIPPVYNLIYDDNLNVEMLWFTDELGNNVVNSEGYHYIQFSYEQGNMVRLTHHKIYGEYVELFMTNEGFAGVVADYNERGYITGIVYYDKFTENVITDYGYCMAQIAYDEQGNITRYDYFGTNGEPVISNIGFASIESVYDERGYQIENYGYGTDGELINDSNSGAAIIKNEYDDHGNLTARSYYGKDSKPVLTTYGYASFNNIYDTRGNIIETSYHGVNDELILSEDGYARYVSEYDDSGNITKVNFYGTDGEAIISNDGYAGLQSTYDDNGYKTSTYYLGLDEEYITSNFGYAGYENSYDDYGNLTEVVYLDTNGQPTLNNSGYASYKEVYDSRGNLLVDSYFGEDGELIVSDYGYATLKNVYDERGNVIEEYYYGADGRLMLNENFNFAVGKAEFDERGKGIQVEYFGVDNKPIISTYGVASIKYEYDELGYLIGESFYGVNGEMIVRPEYNYAAVKSVFNEFGDLTQTSYYGADGELMINSEFGYAKATIKYDENHNMVEMALYGEDEEPIAGVLGFALRIDEYDENGKFVSIKYYDENGDEVFYN